MHRSGPVVRTRAGVNGSCAIVGQRRLGGVRRCPRTAATCVFFLVFLKAGNRFSCAAAILVLPSAEIVRFLGRCISTVSTAEVRYRGWLGGDGLGLRSPVQEFARS